MTPRPSIASRLRAQDAPTRRPTPSEELDELCEMALDLGALSDPRVAALVAELTATLPVGGAA